MRNNITNINNAPSSRSRSSRMIRNRQNNNNNNIYIRFWWMIVLLICLVTSEFFISLLSLNDNNNNNKDYSGDDNSESSLKYLLQQNIVQKSLKNFHSSSSSSSFMETNRKRKLDLVHDNIDEDQKQRRRQQQQQQQQQLSDEDSDEDLEISSKKNDDYEVEEETIITESNQNQQHQQQQQQQQTEEVDALHIQINKRQQNVTMNLPSSNITNNHKHTTITSATVDANKYSIGNVKSEDDYDYDYNNFTDYSFIRLQQELQIHIPKNQLQDIPSWSNITNLYGAEPIILGLETCQKYQETVSMMNRTVTTAGMFNTGTNLFIPFFHRNCNMHQKSTESHRTFALPQIPWGKHNPSIARLDNYTVNKTTYQQYNHDHILPIVMVRHPISWMFSTCVHSYGAHWNHNTNNCPHLIHENKTDGTTVPVRVTYGYNPKNKKRTKKKKRFTRYPSLIHLWKEWYESYINDFPFPRLIVRLEDVVYQPEKVIEKICTCAGGTPRYIDDDNNNNNNSNSNSKNAQGNQGSRANIEKRVQVIIPEESVKMKRDRIRELSGHRGTLVKKGEETAGLVKAWINHASITSLWKRMNPRDQHLVQKVLMNNGNNKDHGTNNNELLLKQLHYKLDGL